MMSAVPDGDTNNMVCMFKLPETETSSTRGQLDVENVLNIINKGGIDVDTEDVVNVERMGRYRGNTRPIKVEFATNDTWLKVVGVKQFYYQPPGGHGDIQVNVQAYRTKKEQADSQHRQRRRNNEGLDSLESQFNSLSMGNKQVHKGGIRLPDGWLDYSEMGQRISGTHIVAIKTPLKSQFNAGFTPERVIALTKTQGYRVGMVVNLTFTDKYYDPQSFTDLGVESRKIKVPGRVIPLEYLVQDFIGLLKEFDGARHRHKDDVILVHCTHGLNRTGYMVCRYLIQEKGLSPDEAIQSFNQARGYDMERANYLESLRSQG